MKTLSRTTLAVIGVLLVSINVEPAGNRSAEAMVVYYDGAVDWCPPCIILSDSASQRRLINEGRKNPLCGCRDIVGTSDSAEFLALLERLWALNAEQKPPSVAFLLVRGRAKKSVYYATLAGRDVLREALVHFPAIRQSVETEFLGYLEGLGRRPPTAPRPPQPACEPRDVAYLTDLLGRIRSPVPIQVVDPPAADLVGTWSSSDGNDLSSRIYLFDDGTYILGIEGGGHPS